MRNRSLYEGVLVGGALILVSAIGAISLLAKAGLQEVLVSLHAINVWLLAMLLGVLFFFSAHRLAKIHWYKPILYQISFLTYAVVLVGLILGIVLLFGNQILPWQIQKLDTFKSVYLNPVFFVGRSLAVLLLLVFGIKAISRTTPQQNLAVWLVLSFFALCVIGWDWIVAYIPDWYSTLFPWMFFVVGFQLAIAVLAFIAKNNRESGKLFINLGRYLFTTSIFYGYLWYSQNMLIWYGNLPIETNFMVTILNSEISIWAIISILFCFGLPMFILFHSKLKQQKLFIRITSILVALGQWMNFVVLLKANSTSFHFFIELLIFLGVIGIMVLLKSFINHHDT